MKALIGNYDARVDAKRRLAIAASIRDQIASEDGENFVVVPDPGPEGGRERYLWLFPDDYFRRLVAKMKRSELSPQDRRARDQWVAMAMIVKPDAQGRVVLPEKSLQSVVVAEQVTLSCSGDHVEVWPRKKWQDEYGTEMNFSRGVVDRAVDAVEQDDTRRAGLGSPANT